MSSMLAKVNRLCTPAYVYFVLAVVGTVVVGLQNLGSNKKLCVGKYSCSVPNTLMIFIAKVLWIILYTYFLNYLCSAGYTSVSWFLVLLPFIFMFFGLVALFMMKRK
jgi:hypothetical protein